MNRFEQQIFQAAQALRDRHDATLKVPNPPKVNGHKKGAPLKWWLSTAAALCIGYLVGSTMPFASSPAPTTLAAVTEPTIQRDTIFTTIRDTLFLDREVPVYLPAPADQNLAVVLPQTDSLQTAPNSTAAAPNKEMGKSILDDTIHFALLVSM
ncbi:MAG: hypothetical protein II200_01830 [Bacteroidaceae bacterium]|nr:hypothetical protein [Bacteroidaceae bacterium]